MIATFRYQEIENNSGKLRVASVQIPFIPTKIISGFNSFSEPEGGINLWILGQKNEKSTSLQNILKYSKINTELCKLFKSEYITWINTVIEEILDYICTYEDPDIILFPEYLLPEIDSAELEDSREPFRTLIKYSKNRSIVAGIGVINCRDEKGYNKFVVVNDEKLKYGKKMVTNDFEKSFVTEGNGPFIYELSLRTNKDVKVMVAMCSDFINLGKSPSSYASAIDTELEKKEWFASLCEEHKEIENIKDKIKDFVIDLVLVPCFTTKLDDMIKISEIQSVRGYRAIILANCSFFGGSFVCFAPYEGAEHQSFQIEAGHPGIIIADIPYPTHQLLLMPVSKSIRDMEAKYPIQFYHKEYSIDFDPFQNETDNPSIEIYSENFFDLISRRLNAAIIYLILALLRLPDNKESNRQNREILDLLTLWKSLQRNIASTEKVNYDTSYDQLPDIFVPYIDKFIFKSGIEQYCTILDQLETIVDDKYKELIKQVKTHIEEDAKPEPFHIMSSDW